MIPKIVGAVVLLGAALMSIQPLAADPLNDCRARCARFADADGHVCQELLSNASCGSAVEGNRRRCVDYCERTYPRMPILPSLPDNSFPNGSPRDNAPKDGGPSRDGRETGT